MAVLAPLLLGVVWRFVGEGRESASPTSIARCEMDGVVVRVGFAPSGTAGAGADRRGAPAGMVRVVTVEKPPGADQVVIVGVGPFVVLGALACSSERRSGARVPDDARRCGGGWITGLRGGMPATEVERRRVVVLSASMGGGRCGDGGAATANFFVMSGTGTGGVMLGGEPSDL